MTNIGYPKGNGVEPGSWHGAKAPDKLTALFLCPTCGRMQSLSGHEIDKDGNVSPSLVCYYDDCDFHEFITLNGWVEQERDA